MEKQIKFTVSIDETTRKNLEFLKDNGVNISFIFRKLIKEEAEKIKNNK